MVYLGTIMHLLGVVTQEELKREDGLKLHLASAFVLFFLEERTTQQ